jgi:hypothetical protein
MLSSPFCPLSRFYRPRPRLVAAFTAFLSLFTLLSVPILGEEEVLTNQDVVKMVQAGLGEEVVVAKVRETPRVSFHLSVDDLVSLRKDGVGERIVQAMLDRNHPEPKSPETEMAASLGAELVKVSLKTSEGVVPLSIIRGDMSSAGFMGWGNIFMNYPGLHARVRTPERRPALLVKSSTPITGGRYFIGKLDADSRNSVRSLKVSSLRQGLKAAFVSSRGAVSPDPDWTVPFEAFEESPGLWKVIPKTGLEPGEYGWYVDLGTGPQAAGLFDFGID